MRSSLKSRNISSPPGRCLAPPGPEVAGGPGLATSVDGWSGSRRRSPPPRKSGEMTL